MIIRNLSLIMPPLALAIAAYEAPWTFFLGEFSFYLEWLLTFIVVVLVFVALRPRFSLVRFGRLFDGVAFSLYAYALYLVATGTLVQPKNLMLHFAILLSSLASVAIILIIRACILKPLTPGRLPMLSVATLCGLTLILNYLYGKHAVLNNNWVAIASCWSISFVAVLRASMGLVISKKLLLAALQVVLVFSLYTNSIGGFTASAVSSLILLVSPGRISSYCIVASCTAFYLSLGVFFILFPGLLFSATDYINQSYGSDISSGRFAMWEALSKIFASSESFLGFGLSAIPSNLGDLDVYHATTAHNLVVDSLTRVGAAGLVIKVTVIFMLGVAAVRNYPSGLRFLPSIVILQFFIFSSLYDVGGFTHLSGTFAYLTLLALASASRNPRKVVVSSTAEGRNVGA